MTDNIDEKISEINKQNIEEDLEKLQVAKKLSISHSTEPKIIDSSNSEDSDDISHYKHETDDGIKVLDDTFTINRKAVFHDLDRIKHWRESVDQGDFIIDSKKDHHHNVMDQNIDHILNKMPTIDAELDGTVSSQDVEKLVKQLDRKFSQKK